MQAVTVRELKVQYPALLNRERRHADLFLRFANRRLERRFARLDLSARPVNLARAQAAGCIAVITKPFEIDTLLNTVAQVLNSSVSAWGRRAVGGDCQT